MMKIISYNVNGIRAAMSKGLKEWLDRENADIVCIQETKAQPDQMPSLELQELGYRDYYFSAQKKGYSGVAILTRIKPDQVVMGMNLASYDNEGRFIRIDIGDLTVISVYHPSGSSGDERQGFKMKWLDDFRAYVNQLRVERPNLIIAGDYNICHQAIDIHDPKGNANSSGFLPEERQWMTDFLSDGYVDSFRHLCKEPHHYSWWSYRAQARSKNKGWRIDYLMITPSVLPRLQEAFIRPEALHSDHCPVGIVIQ